MLFHVSFFTVINLCLLAQTDELLAHGVKRLGPVSCAGRVGVPAWDEPAFRPPKRDSHLATIRPDIIQRACGHGALDIHRGKERDAPAETAAQQIQPHILLLIHVDSIQPDFDQVIEDIDDIATAMQEGE